MMIKANSMSHLLSNRPAQPTAETDAVVSFLDHGVAAAVWTTHAMSPPLDDLSF